MVVGLAGAQGSGKSTMAPRLAGRLAATGLRAHVLALDDFYLTHDERAELARSVHPLLATRGVPGTHDLALLTGVSMRCLRAAARPSRGSTRRPTIARRLVPIDGAGRCRAARRLVHRRTSAACGRARRSGQRARAGPMTRTAAGAQWVNARLATDYAALFARLALRILLRAPRVRRRAAAGGPNRSAHAVGGHGNTRDRGASSTTTNASRAG